MDKYIYDCIIIGAGISGISFAHYLTSIDQNILILEKDGRAGGRFIPCHPIRMNNTGGN